MKNTNAKKSETYKKIGIGAAIVVVLAIIILLLLRSCGAPTDEPGGIEFDPSATEGGWMKLTSTPSATASTRKSRRA